MNYEKSQIGNGTFYTGDCFDVMNDISDNSIDMVLCDLPYGTTQNKWDSILDLNQLWAEYWRLLSSNNKVVALTAQCPFDKILGSSCIDKLKYEWIWEKPKATGHLNAKKQPMKAHENVLIFYDKQCEYKPQMTEGKEYKPSGGKSKKDNYGDFEAKRENNGKRRYPRSVQFITHESKPIHPTQKPVDLFEYLIKTYSNEGDLILDNCAGSGTLAIACENTNRRWICIEKEQEYADKAIERITNHIIEMK